MMSIRNSDASVEKRILDAAAACILAFGVERTTMTEIARRARVSRPTIYRRWPDIRWVIAEVLTIRISGVLEAIPDRGVGREAMVDRVVLVAEHLRNDEIVQSVIRNAPSLAMVYIAERLGTSQQILIEAAAPACLHGVVRGIGARSSHPGFSCRPGAAPFGSTPAIAG